MTEGDDRPSDRAADDSTGGPDERSRDDRGGPSGQSRDDRGGSGEGFHGDDADSGDRVGGDGTPSAGRPAPEPQATEESYDGAVDYFLHTDDEAVAAIRDVVTTVLAVAGIGLLLFAVSGVWPPLVAVESGSMEPHMYKGDLVFIVDEERFAGAGAVNGTGVVTYRAGQETGYWSFGDYGNVIIYQPDGRDTTPIIHRASFYVTDGEHWYERANKSYVAGADSCAELAACPADHAGFITLGDNNHNYDQAVGRSDVVKPAWVKGKAKVRVPWLGWIRLKFAGESSLL